MKRLAWVFILIMLLAAGCGWSGGDEIELVDGFMAALQAKDVDTILSYDPDDFVDLNIATLDEGEVPLKDDQRVLRRGYDAVDCCVIPDQDCLAADRSDAALSGGLTALRRAPEPIPIPK